MAPVGVLPVGMRCQLPAAPHGHRFSVLGLLWALAMKMAVEEINNASALLPGVRLGYDLFDTCSEPVVAMKHSLTFVAKAGSHTIAAHCDYTQHQPRVLAVVGPHSSELALVTSKFFSFFLMPQVCPSPSSPAPHQTRPWEPPCQQAPPGHCRSATAPARTG